MSKKFDAFMDALAELCKSSDIRITVDGWQDFEVWDLKDKQTYPLFFRSVVDRTKAESTQS